MAEVRGAREVLASLRGVPKEFNKALREESKQIATAVMVPAWQAGAHGAGPFGPLIAGSIRARSDRQPAIVIGKASPKLRGGLTPNMARWVANAGQPADGTFNYEGRRGSLVLSTFYGSAGWMDGVDRDAYKATAMRMWTDAVERTVARFNAGGL